MSEYPALKNTFEKSWLSQWLQLNNIAPLQHKNWEMLGLKERTLELTRQLNTYLEGNSVTEKRKHLYRLFEKHKTWPKGDMKYWPIFGWIEQYGDQTPMESLHFLEKFTKYFTAEFAVRPIIEKEEETVFNFLEQRLSHPDEHVRRWISEGTRPKLPWGKQLHTLNKNPERGLKLISPLVNDNSLYVRKSVANHLNDVYKISPELALKYATKWWDTKNTHGRWIVKHGLRSAIKDGFKPALSLLGYTDIPIKSCSLHLSNSSIAFDGHIALNLEGCFYQASNAIIDYQVDFVRANNKRGVKVFKWKTLTNVSSFNLHKKHSFKPISTRKYYPGTHYITVFINGEKVASSSFELLKPCK